MGAMKSFLYLSKIILKPLLFFALLILGTGYLCFPWAMPFPGRETLSGKWIGPITSSRGPSGFLFLSLELKPSLQKPWTYVFRSAQYNSSAGAPLQGQAMLCTQRLGRIDFDVNGYTTARSGETLNLLITPRSSSRKGPRFRMDGRWSNTKLNFLKKGDNLDEALGEPGREGNNLQDWIKFKMRKGSEGDWAKMCEKLK
jgi:hypothetical protein